MPKVGMEPIRRKAMVQATIEEIGRAGTLDVTVTQIAKRAGVSTALVHHYFGSKEKIFMAAMRHVLSVYGAEVRGALLMSDTPQQRVEAIVRASFSTNNFKKEVLSAWLNFYVAAQTLPEAQRLLRVYQRRIVSNLTSCLRPMVGARSPAVARRLAALIDGIYLRMGLGGEEPNANTAVTMVLELLELEQNRQLH
ncbi:transcriptional regulator BetI [Cognatishimia sp.]|uniref:choline-binding transcriptional repressor BetI n=1 Tax=Cognatishimia sp. TaxID=2211648 RepID=UPI003517E9F4|nr:transcriptional regulator BetI [Cognatishimia sp.]